MYPSQWLRAVCRDKVTKLQNKPGLRLNLDLLKLVFKCMQRPGLNWV